MANRPRRRPFLVLFGLLSALSLAPHAQSEKPDIVWQFEAGG